MSKNGGYRIIDLGDVTIGAATAEHAVVEGIYDAIEGTRKPILISGLHTADVECHDVFVQPEVSSGDFVFTACGLAITVNDDDEIYYTPPAEE